MGQNSAHRRPACWRGAEDSLARADPPKQCGEEDGSKTGPPSFFFIEAKGNRRRCPPGQCGGMEQERSDHPSADFVCDGAPRITFSDARFHTQPAPQNMYADRAAAPGAGGSGPERDLRNVKRQRKIPGTRRFRGFWQRVKDSNPHKRSQSPVCYHYTNPLCSFDEQVLLYQRISICQELFDKFPKIFDRDAGSLSRFRACCRARRRSPLQRSRFRE